MQKLLEFCFITIVIYTYMYYIFNMNLCVKYSTT